MGALILKPARFRPDFILREMALHRLTCQLGLLGSPILSTVSPGPVNKGVKLPPLLVGKTSGSLAKWPATSRPAMLFLAFALVLAANMGCVPTSWGDGGKKGAVSAGSPPPSVSGQQRFYYFIKSNYYEIDQNDKAALENMKKASDLTPASYYLKMETARLYARNGDNDTALKYASEAIALNPGAPGPREFSAWVSTAAGHWEAAISQYKEILRLHPGNSEALTQMGALYAETGRLGEAEAIFKELTSTNPNALSYYFLGSFYGKTGRPKEAISALNTSLKKDPDFFEAMNELAILYEAEGNLKAAERVYRSLIKSQPQMIIPKARLANLLFKTGRKKEAEALLGEINVKSLQGPAQLSLGILFREQGLMKEAAEALEGALKKAPKNEYILYLLATTQLELDEFDKARENLSKIPKNGDKYVDARLILASITENEDKDKRLDEALKIISAAVKAKPGEPRLKLAQAMLLDDMGDTAKARKVILEASKKFPDEAEVFFRLGVIEDKLSNKQATIAAMRKAVELNPNHADALNYLAYTWAEQGENLEEALAMAEKADELKPDSGYIIDTLGWIHHRLGNDKKALTALERAVPLSGGDPVVLDHLGDVLMNLGRHKEALKTYRKALESDFSNHQELQEVLDDKIRQLSQDR